MLAHPTGAYLAPILLGTILLLAGGLWYTAAAGGGGWALVAAVVLLSIPASEMAIALVQRVITHTLPPRRLARLDFTTGVPADARTMVVVPTMLTSVEGVAALLEHLEVVALGNLDPQVHFAILSDCADAPDAGDGDRRRAD